MSYFIPSHVRSVRSEGGTVLLNLQSGAYFTLNAVGVLVWDQIQGGSSRDAAITAVERRFHVERDRVARDVDPMLDRLIARGLLGRGEAPVSAPPPAKPAVEKDRADLPASIITRAGRFAMPWRLGWTIAAYLALVGMDVLIKIAGFARFHRFVSERRTRARSAIDPADVGRIRAAVDAAAAFYFKRAWCLQRSAATTYLLRLRGFPAELVIGVRRVPFLAHAWVEIGGVIVNDSERVRAFHQIIERC